MALRFKDFLTVDYKPGEPEEIKYRAYRRKRTSMGGGPVEDTANEALSPEQRRARARLMKRYKARIAMGRKRAAKRIASPEKLKQRARKMARKMLFRKLTRDIPKDQLTYQRRTEIEKRLEKMKARIDKLAQKILPQIRKDEIARKRKAASK